MFDKLVFGFILLWFGLLPFVFCGGALQYALPGEELLDRLDLLEETVAKENWPAARKIINEINVDWKKIQLNQASRCQQTDT